VISYHNTVLNISNFKVFFIFLKKIFALLYVNLCKKLFNVKQLRQIETNN